MGAYWKWKLGKLNMVGLFSVIVSSFRSFVPFSLLCAFSVNINYSNILFLCKQKTSHRLKNYKRDEMSVFLKILQCIFCCEEKKHHDIHDKTCYTSPLLKSHSYDPSSAPSYSDLLNNSAIAKPVYDSKSLDRTDEVSQNLKSSSHLQTTVSDKSLSSSTTCSSSSKPPSLSSSNLVTSSTLSPSFSKPPSSYTSPSLSSTKAPPTSSTPSPSFPKSATSSFITSSSPQLTSSFETPLSSYKAPPSSNQSPSSPKPSISSSHPSSSFPKPPTSSFKPSSNSPKAPSSSSESSQSSLETCPSSTKPTLTPLPSNLAIQQTKTKSVWVQKDASPLSSYKAPPSSNLSPSTPKPSTFSSHPSPSFPKPPTSSFKPSSNSPKATSTSCESSESSLGTCPSSDKPRPSSKPTLSPLPSNLTNQQTKTKYVWVQKDTSPVYKIPKEIEDLIEEEIVLVPEVLKKPLSSLTYKDYFAALLYAEDFYIEKWNGFLLENVTVKLQRRHKNRYCEEGDWRDDKIFVSFEIDSITKERPILLPRDFVFARPLGSKVEPFQGIIYLVVKSNTVLAEFGEDFHSQHNSTCKYDVSFSFNRVCIKQARQAIVSASDSMFHNFIFPNFVSRKCFPTSPHVHCNHKLDRDQNSAVGHILSLKGSPPPYLVEGKGNWSVVQKAVVQLYRSSNLMYRILICAPTNRACDALMRNLKHDISESDMFQANAAFGEVDGVPIDILPSCVYKKECFVCPSLQELQKFRVIFSTFMSSFRLHNEGITAGHFSHIFLMDASSATEPETMVTLANLANEETFVVVTGVLGDCSSWVRSDIARHYGLRISYFERLRESEPYRDLDPEFITRVGDRSMRIKR